MPQTAKEQELHVAAEALAADYNVPTPLNAEQAEWLRALAAELRHIPAHVHGGLIRYMLAGTRTGSCLKAILEGELFPVLRCCDDANLGALPGWAMVLHHAAPPGSFGSRSRVAAWIAHGGLARSTPAESAQ